MIAQLLSTVGIAFVIWRFIRYRLPVTDLHNIPGPSSKSWWLGNFQRVLDPHGWKFHMEIAQKYGGIVRIDALLGEKQLYVFDPRALQSITTMDQSVFPKSSQSLSLARLVFGEGLLGATGEKHRKQRRMLNPVFSAAHMRDMPPIFYSVVHNNTLAKIVEDGPQEIDIFGWMTRTSLELVGQSGLGYSFDSLNIGTPEHPYARNIKLLVPLLSHFEFLQTYVGPWAMEIGPSRFRRAVVNVIPYKTVHHIRDIVDLMYDTSVRIYKEKMTALEAGDEVIAQQIAQGKDIISLLMRENMKASDEDRLEEADVIDQISTIIFAAMDTTSTALSGILYVLANHPEAQNHLRQEIFSAQEEHGVDLPYDVLISLPYLEAVCRESMRLYPPLVQLVRESAKTAVIPLSKPIIGINGKKMQEVVVPPGTSIYVSIIGSNRNPELWGPDAHKWKPERWLEDAPAEVSDAKIPGVYANLMTFFGGGRSCIGYKYSQLEMKAVLVHLISSFNFEPSNQEICWEMTYISAPTVKGIAKSQLPMLVSRV